ASQALGLACGAITVVVLFFIGRRGGAGLWSLAAPAALLAILPYSVECLLGLEMPLFVLLVVAGIAWHAREAPTASAPPTGLSFARATMTRPEGVMIFGWSFVADAVRAFRREPFPWRRWMVRGTAFAALYLPYYVWRYAYYGLPLPNTFYAKAGEGLAFAD